MSKAQDGSADGDATEIEPFARGRDLQQVGGNSYGVTFPIDQLREHGIVDEDGNLVEDAEARVAVVKENGEPVQLRSELDL